MNMKFEDFFLINPPESTSGHSCDPDVRNKASTSKGLKVVMSASHAGRLTKNFTMYPPSTFQRCSHSFVTPYQKPVLTHHNDQSDPIGRIIGARFLPYQPSDFADDHRNVFLHFKDKVTNTGILDSIKFLEETGVIFENDWKGLGELELETLITDQMAIEKILDGRYNTVSVGMEPHQVYCSVCNKDWMKDMEPCEHRKGERDEESDRLMYLISGDITGFEVSYITRPADDLASNKFAEVVPTTGPRPVDDEEESPEERHNVQNPVYTVDSLDQRTVTYELLDGFVNETSDFTEEKVQEEKEEVTEEIQDSQEKALSLEDAIKTAIETPELFTDEMSVMINLAIEDEALTTKQRKNLPDSAFCGPDRSYPADTPERAASALARVKQFGSASLQKRVRACVCKKYSDFPSCKRGTDSVPAWTETILDELKSTIKHPVTGLDTTLGQFIFGTEDSLVEQDFEKLSGSVFCGPNRSFHVISIDHYEAAIGLLETYQGSGDMAKIKESLDASKEVLEEELSTVSDESETSEEIVDQVEETETETEVVETEENSSSCIFDALEDDGLIKLHIDMEKEMLSRKLRAPRQCFDCESKDEERKVLEDKVKELEETQLFLRKEIKVANLDCQAAEQEVVNLTEELTVVYKESVLKGKALTDKEKDVEELKSSVEEMDLLTLKDSYAPVMEQVDSVVEFVRSGLTQEVPADANVTIEDAEEVSEEEIQVDEEKVEYSDLEKSLFKKLVKFNDSNKRFAEKHLQELKVANKIKKDLTLEEICEIVGVN